MSSYKHIMKDKGDLIRSDEWNVLGTAVDQVYHADIGFAGNKTFTGSLSITDSLTVKGDVGVTGNITGNKDLTITGNAVVNSRADLGGLNVTGQSCTGKLQVTEDAVFNGNVGIGTASPTEKLEVAGSIKVQGDLDVHGTHFSSDLFTGTISPPQWGCSSTHV